MAGSGDQEDGGAASVEAGGEHRGLSSLLCGEERDFLVRNNGEQVSISSLHGKTVGLYFSASWCGPCRRFTPKLIEVYLELSSEGKNFEVVFVSGDEDEESFNGYFLKMPWLAVPFSDAKTREQLNELFNVTGIPHLLILDASGKVLNEEGVSAVREYGTEGFPFTTERMKKLEEDEEAAKKEQTLRSVLASSSRDHLISNNGAVVPVLDLEGKIVALYFSIASYKPCAQFTSMLEQIYGKLKEKGDSFEVVLVSLDEDEPSFCESFASMPWFAIPFQDKSRERLARYFELRKLPSVVIIGADGKTLNVDLVELVEEHGVEAWEAFPFHHENLNLLAEKAKAKLEAQTLESLLVSGELDYVVGKQGVKIPVKELVGKNILLYFSAHWCGPCRAFLPKLMEEYHKIKNKDNAFEVVFVSSDQDQSSFEDFFSGMPWLALPFGDERKKHLTRTFKVRGIPSVIAIGPTGRTVTKDARNLLMTYGADAYPFTENRIKELEQQIEEMAKGWPEKIKHELHEEHDLLLTRSTSYSCDGCGDVGNNWSYRCIDCNFDLHPQCASKENKKDEKHNEEHGEAIMEGYVCDGDVCRKI